MDQTKPLADNKRERDLGPTTRGYTAVPSWRQRAEPGPGQESVWDYPRPPRLERVSDVLRVRFAGETIAETFAGYRVLETSHPPVYYFPPESVKTEFLIAAPQRSFCEFKGVACYWSLDVRGTRSERAAWSYAEPTEPFLAVREFFAFYASRSTNARSDTSECEPRKESFMVAGLHPRLSGRSTAGRRHSTGERRIARLRTRPGNAKATPLVGSELLRRDMIGRGGWALLVVYDVGLRSSYITGSGQRRTSPRYVAKNRA